ncbi:MAG: hypothetical protein ACK4VM_10435 [Bosea sp. (in: a-proteobacteria)]
MLRKSDSALARRLLRRFAGQGLFVMAASAGVVALLAAGEYPAPAQAANEPPETLITWSSAIAPDGKLQQRHGGPDLGRDLDRAFSASTPMTTAALAMPLAVSFSGPTKDLAPARVAADAPPRAPRPQSFETARAPIPAADKARPSLRAAEPLRIQPLDQPVAQAGQAQPGLLAAVTRPVTATLARATGLVTGAAAAMGEAGSWTVAQAAGLVPRW